MIRLPHFQRIQCFFGRHTMTDFMVMSLDFSRPPGRDICLEGIRFMEGELEEYPEKYDILLNHLYLRCWCTKVRIPAKGLAL